VRVPRAGRVRAQPGRLTATPGHAAELIRAGLPHLRAAGGPLRKRGNGIRSAVVTLPAGTTIRFRYLAEGGVWFDDDAAEAPDGQDATITVPG
jgi:hypothetical protein